MKVYDLLVIAKDTSKAAISNLISIKTWLLSRHIDEDGHSIAKSRAWIRDKCGPFYFWRPQ
jgi:hypothetical protein